MNSAASEYQSPRGTGSGADVAGQIYQRLAQNLATLAARHRQRVDTRLPGRGRRSGQSTPAV